jgi:carbonic anhydrase
MPHRTPEERNPHRPAGEPPAPLGLVLTCSAGCFAPDLLAAQLLPDAWLIHRTPANVVPPYGAGALAEEELLEHTVESLGIRKVVVCGHSTCRLADLLREPDQPADDATVRGWLPFAEAARRALAGLTGPDTRTAAERNALAQLHSVMTHPGIARAVARGSLDVAVWLHDDAAGELLYPGDNGAGFSRLAALHPEHNLGLRPEVMRRPRPRRLPPVLDLRRLCWA